MTSIVIRCDGGAALGMGHVSRCLALAEELRGEHACAVTFAMRDRGSAGVQAVRAGGYDVDTIAAAESDDYSAELSALAQSRRAVAIVVDVRDALSRASLDVVRAGGVRVAVVDDGTDRRLASDLAFYPPVPQVDELDWSGYSGRRFTGWDWVLLKREFANASNRSDRSDGTDRLGRSGGSGGSGRSGGSRESGGSDRLGGLGLSGGADSSGRGGATQASAAIDVLVTMGGSDPAGMTAFTVAALNLLPMPLAVQVVIGPAFARAIELIDVAARSKHSIHVIHAPLSMASLMKASRIAVASFGVSAYELAACGVPAVHLCLTPDHERSSSAFAREEIALTAGVFAGLQPRDVADAAARLIGDARRRMRMAARARALVDGLGAGRVAALIAG